MDKVHTRLAFLDKEVFSRGVRLTLIYSVLTGIPIYFSIYFLSPFRALCSMCKKLEKVMRVFFFFCGKGLMGKGSHLVRLEVVGSR